MTKCVWHLIKVIFLNMFGIFKNQLVISWFEIETQIFVKKEKKELFTFTFVST